MSKIVIGVDPGKRMGVAILDGTGNLVDWGIYQDGEVRSKQLFNWLDITIKGAIPIKAWIEKPDGHVMSGRIGLRQTARGIRQSVFHHTNVNSIFQLGVVAGKVAMLCDALGIPYEFISAQEVKRLVTGDPVTSKAKLALYLESEGYAIPRLPSGKPDPEGVDALAIALAGKKKMEDDRED